MRFMRAGSRADGPRLAFALLALVLASGAARAEPVASPADLDDMIAAAADNHEPLIKNYLIITAPAYAGSAPLEQFIAAKAAAGFTVATYTVPSGTANQAIKAYITSLWGTPQAPAFILLVGDTDGYTSGSNTIPHWTGAGPRHATTDLPYACMDAGDDWYPDIYIGRFSVRSAAQLQDVVSKTLFVEAGDFPDQDYVKRAAFLATNDMSSGAEETHDFVIDNYMVPAQFDCTKIYARLGGGTQDITNAVNEGQLFVTYFGHSASSGWSTPAFGQGNVQALANAGLYGLVCGWSCNTAHYSYDECFGETWQRVANRGAAVYLSASDYIYWGAWEDWDESRSLEKYFYRSIFVDGMWEVRPAWDAALYRLLAQYGPGDPRVRDFFEEFTLLGDPQLRLPQGRTFTLDPVPLTLALCSPPANLAQYAVQVTKIGDFSEVVTLTASGGPAGATYSFSVNHAAPPFLSILRIGNIQGGSPGAYDVQIDGASASVQRSVTVGLDLSTSAPAAVTLVSPPNGAVDVARMPLLAWQAAPQAVDYDVQVATNPNFAPLVYSATATNASHTVSAQLEAARLHYWRVQANNGCGSSGFSAPFTFTTVAQVEYFTELFAGSHPFDLDNFSVSFIPNGSPDFYLMCGGPATTLPTDPTGGTTIALGDDSYQHISLAESRAVQLYNLAYNNFYVGSNGYITFGAGDSDYDESFSDHFDLPRISALYNDLNPGAQGTVSWRQLDDRAAVTFQNVPEYGSSSGNTFQTELFFDGRIRFTWLNIPCNDVLVGLSRGAGVPSDFIASDISAARRCPLPGDLNCDGSVNDFDISPFVLALTSTPPGYPEYYAQWPDCDHTNGDVNGDGDVNNFDISPFVALLSGS